MIGVPSNNWFGVFLLGSMNKPRIGEFPTENEEIPRLCFVIRYFKLDVELEKHAKASEEIGNESDSTNWRNKV